MGRKGLTKRSRRHLHKEKVELIMRERKSIKNVRSKNNQIKRSL